MPQLSATGGNRTLTQILNISGDYPDPVGARKTTVVRRLIDLTRDHFDHQVISLNRADPGALDAAVKPLIGSKLEVEILPTDEGAALTYYAPGKGIWHRRNLRMLGETIAGLHGDDPPRLIIAWKLTIEGIAAAETAQRLNVPYLLVIQGNTDAKILNARPDLRGHFSRIFHGARVVVSFAPWSLAFCEAKLGTREGPSFVIPCPTDLDRPQKSSAPGDGMVSLFHLDNYRDKNIHGLVGAMRVLRERGIDDRLDVIGGGSAASLAHCQRLSAGIADVRFSGALGREEVSERLNRGSVMVLPSTRESFGLAFIEALFAGIPIVYPANRAIAGYFDGYDFARAVDPGRPHDIADAVQDVLQNEASLKRSIADWQHSEHARQFMRPAIAQRFTDAINTALGVQ